MTTTRALTVRKAAWLKAIGDARQRDYLLTIKAYCDGPNCTARQVEVHLKDYDGALLTTVTRRTVCCPLCGRALECVEVRTAAEQARAYEREARMSVNAQIYERDHDSLGVPLEVMRDDRLPTTMPPRDDDHTGRPGPAVDAQFDGFRTRLAALDADDDQPF